MPVSGWAILPKGGRGGLGEIQGRGSRFRWGRPLPGPAPGLRCFGAGIPRGLCVVSMLSGDPAPSQWALHYHLTDEETEAWREATGSLEPPAPGPCTWPPPRATVWEPGKRLLPVLPAVRKGGVPGTAFSSARRLPTPRSRSWLQAHPSALPIHPLSLPGRASRPYITRRQRRSLRQPG